MATSRDDSSLTSAKNADNLSDQNSTLGATQSGVEQDGTDKRDRLFGGSGPDTLNGFGGNDILWGRAGDDVLDGGENGDRLLGEEGNDRLFGRDGNDRLSGGEGDDTLDGGEGTDVLNGDEGNDQLTDLSGNNLFRGGVGDDTITAGDGHDTIRAGQDDDIADGGDGDDLVTGSTGNDTIRGGDGDDTIRGQEDDDVLLGGDGQDDISGGIGNDSIEGNDGDDTLRGKAGDDTIIGGAGDDEISGGIDHDTLEGGAGSDTINGGRGDDTIDGGTGTDTLRGGGDADIFIIRNDGSIDTIIDFRANQGDQIQLEVPELLSDAGLVDLTKLRLVPVSGNTDLLEADLGNGFEALVFIRSGRPYTLEDVIIGGDPGDPNTAPRITSGGAGSVVENATLTDYTITTEDDEGDAVTLSLEGEDASLFTINGAGQLELTGAPDFEAPSDADGDGVYDVTVVASDGALEATQRVLITVTDENEAPLAGGALSETVSEDDAPVTVDLLSGASDPDAGDTLEVVGFAVSSGDAAGIAVNGSTLTITPSAYDALNAGEQEVIVATYEVRDTGGRTATKSITITVDGADDVDPNTAPRITSGGTGSVAENATLTDYTVTTEDDEGDTVTLSLEGEDASLFTINGSGQLELTAAPDFEAPSDADGDGVYDVTVVASDGALVATQRVLITVTDENEAPLAGGALSETVSQDDAPVTVDLLSGATDPDAGDALEVVGFAISSGDGAGLAVNGSTLTITPSAYDALNAGEQEVIVATYEVRDTGGQTATKSITITVDGADDVDPNTAPRITSGGTGSVAENTTLTDYTVTTEDDEGDTVTLSLEGGDASLFTINGSGQLELTGAPDFEAPSDADGDGVYDVTVVASDGALEATQRVLITVTDENEAPLAGGALSETVSEDDAPVTVDLLSGATDPDAGDTLEVVGFAVSSGDASGIAVNGSELTITPSAYDALNAGEQEVIVATYEVRDTGGLTASKSITITVDGADEAGENQAPNLAVALSNPSEFTNAPNIVLTGSDDREITDVRILTPEGEGMLTSAQLDTLNDQGTLSLTLSDIEALIGATIDDGDGSVRFEAFDAQGAVSNAADVTFELDRQPPTVVSVEPIAPGKAPAAIVVTYSEAIIASPALLADFSITPRDTAIAPVAFSSLVQTSPTTVQLNLPITLENSVYDISLSAGVTDVAGNAVIGSLTSILDVSAPTRVTEMSPAQGDRFVNVDREITVGFDRPIDPETLNSDTFQILDGDEPIAGTIRVANNGLLATFFLEQGTTLPSSKRLQIALDGDAIKDLQGNSVDVDGDGIAGGQSVTTFDTVSLVRIEGTNLEGFIFDSNRRGPDGEDLPLEGVVVKVVGLPGVEAVTDENGRFFLEDLPAPEVYLDFDASAVTAETGFQYGAVGKPAHTIPGQTVRLAKKDGKPFDVYFAAIKQDDGVDIVAGEETEAGIGEFGLQNLAELFPDIPQSEWEKVKVTVPADSLFFDDGTQATSLDVLVFEPDRIPAPLPQGFDPMVVFTVTAGGASNVDGKAQIEFPNLEGLEAGARRPIMSFDHDIGAWVQTGTAVVSDDGSRLISEGDSGVNTLGWKFVGDEDVSTITIKGGLVPGGRRPPINTSDPDLFDSAVGNLTNATEKGLGVAANLTPLGVAGKAKKVGGLIKAGALTAADAADGNISNQRLAADASALSQFVDGISGFGRAVSGLLSIGDAYEGINSFYEGAGQATVAYEQQTAGDVFGERVQEGILKGLVPASDSQIKQVAGEVAFNSDNAELRALATRIGLGIEEVPNRTQDYTDRLADLRRECGMTPEGVLNASDGAPSTLNGALAQTFSAVTLNAQDAAALNLRGEQLDRDISQLQATVNAAIAQAEADFVSTVDSIDTANLSAAQIESAYRAAETDFTQASDAALDAYRIEHTRLLGEIGGFSTDVVLAYLDQTLEEIDDLTVAAAQVDGLQDAFIAFGEALEAAALADDPAALQQPAQDFLQTVEDAEFALRTLGYNDPDEFYDDLIALGESIPGDLATVTHPFTGTSDSLYAQAILEDGRIIRRQIDEDGTFVVSGPTDQLVTVRFYDVTNNLYSETLYTFGNVDTAQAYATTSPTLDTDGDLLPDVGEIVIGTDPNRRDTDGDGISDFGEVTVGGFFNDGNRLATGNIGGVDVRGNAVDLELFDPLGLGEDRRLFVATESFGLATVDVSAVTDPILVSELRLPGDNTRVVTSPDADFVYVTGAETGLHVVDMSDEVNPFLADTLNTTDGAYSVATLGDLLAIGGDSSLSIVDPVSGAVIDTVLTDRIEDILVSGDQLFVMESDRDTVAVVEGTRIDAFKGALTVFEFTDNELTERDSAELIFANQLNGMVDAAQLRVFVQDDVAYVPTQLDIANVPFERDLERGGYFTFDVADLDNIMLISSFDTGDQQAAVFDLAFNGGNLAFAAAGQRGVELFDVSDPNDTFNRLSDRFDTSGIVQSIEVGAGVVFAADGEDGIKIINPVTQADELPPVVAINLDDLDTDLARDGIQITEGQTISIDVAAFDDSQINEVRIFVDGDPFAQVNRGPFEVDFDIPLLAGSQEATFTVTARAVDASGNATTSDPVLIEVVPDGTAPSVVSVQLISPAQRFEGTQTVVVTLDQPLDPDSVSVDQVQYTDAGGTVFTASSVSIIPAPGAQTVLRYVVRDVPAGDVTMTFDPEGISDIRGNAIGAGNTVTEVATLVATDVAWVSPITANWSDADNWSTGEVPAAGRDVLAPIEAGQLLEVTAPVDPVTSITVTGDGTLSVSDVGNVGPASGDTLLVQTLTNQSRVEVFEGRFTSVGTTDNQGQLTVANGGDFDADGNLTNTGVIRLEDGASFNTQGSIVNEGRILVTAVDRRTDFVTNAPITQLSGGGEIILSQSIENRDAVFNGSSFGREGSLDQTLVNLDNTVSGTGRFGGGFEFVQQPDGLIVARAGDQLRVGNARIENNGTFQAEAGGLLEINSSDFFSSGIFAFRGISIIENAQGVIRADGGVVDLTDSIVRGGQLITTTVDGQEGFIRLSTADEFNFIGGIDATRFINPITASATIEVRETTDFIGDFSNDKSLTISAGEGLRIGGFFADPFNSITTIFNGGGVVTLGGADGEGNDSFIRTLIIAEPFVPDGGDDEFFDFDGSDQFLVQTGRLIIEDHTFNGSGVIGLPDFDGYLEEVFGFSDIDPNNILDAFADDPLNEPPLFSLSDIDVEALGVVDANQSGELLSFANASVFNNGLMTATNGGVLDFFNTNVGNFGVVELNDGTIQMRTEGSFFSSTNSFFNSEVLRVTGGLFDMGPATFFNDATAEFLGGTIQFGGTVFSFGDDPLILVGEADVFIGLSVNEPTVFDLSAGDADVIIDIGTAFVGAVTEFTAGDRLHFTELDSVATTTLDVIETAEGAVLTIDDGNIGTAPIEIRLIAPTGGFGADVTTAFALEESSFGGVAVISTLAAGPTAPPAVAVATFGAADDLLESVPENIAGAQPDAMIAAVGMFEPVSDAESVLFDVYDV